MRYEASPVVNAPVARLGNRRFSALSQRNGHLDRADGRARLQRRTGSRSESMPVNSSNPRSISEEVASLTPRQAQCLALVYERRTSKEIAAQIGLSAATVDTYITEAVSQLSARNRRHAAEIMHAANAPQNLGSQSSGDASVIGMSEVPNRRPTIWSDRLSFRRFGASGNDLGGGARIFSVVVVAVFLAIGFGMLASGLRVMSDLFVHWFG